MQAARDQVEPFVVLLVVAVLLPATRGEGDDRLDSTFACVPGKTLFSSRRCSERRFFQRPGEATKSTVVYLVAEAAEHFGVQVHALCVMSNHLLCAAAHDRCYGQRPVMLIRRLWVV